jgi:hypothetical protein
MRWSGARAVHLSTRTLMRVPTHGLLTRRAAPEGVGVKSTKGQQSRRVPLASACSHSCSRWPTARSPAICSSPPTAVRRSTGRRRCARWTRPRPTPDVAFTTSATPLPASGWPAAWTPGPSRRGWATSPSRPEPVPALPRHTCPPSRSGETQPAPGAAGGHLRARSADYLDDSRPPSAGFVQVRAAIRSEPPVGIEPTTYSLRVNRSTD